MSVVASLLPVSIHLCLVLSWSVPKYLFLSPSLLSFCLGRLVSVFASVPAGLSLSLSCEGYVMVFVSVSALSLGQSIFTRVFRIEVHHMFAEQGAALPKGRHGWLLFDVCNMFFGVNALHLAHRIPSLLWFKFYAFTELFPYTHEEGA
jgi:hypothetical protein